MGRLFDKSVLAGVALIVILLILTTALTIWNTGQMKEDAGWVAHTHHVLDLTGDILLTLVNAETGERGFIVTGKDQFLEPYEAARQQFPGRLARLKTETSDNHRQQGFIKKLAVMSAALMDGLAHGIALRREGASAKQTLDAARAGKKRMDDIRQLIASMESEEHELLADRDRHFQNAYWVAVTTGLITGIVGLLTVGTFVRLLYRSLKARHKAAAAIAEQRELFRTTLASIGDAVITTDACGRVNFLNSVAESLTAWTTQEAAGQPLTTVFRIVNEKTRATVEDPATLALREGRIVGLANHTLLIAKDGRERPIDDSAAPIGNEKGASRGVVLVFRDVTERRRAEESLRRSDERHRFLADVSASLVGSLHYQSILRSVAGLTVPILADSCFFDVLADDDRIERVAWKNADPQQQELTDRIGRFIPDKQSANHPVAKVLRSGRPELLPQVDDQWLQSVASSPEHLRDLRALNLSSVMTIPLRVARRCIGAFTFCYTVSQRRHTAEDLNLAEEIARQAALTVENSRLYTELRETDRRKDEFLAMLAHELRNPLSPIRNALAIMKLAPANGSGFDQVREMMERQVAHMARLLDDLLDVSRISRGRIELRKEVVDLGALVKRAVETSQAAIDERGHELSVSLPTEPLLMEGDPTRLEQVLVNLLNNSAKYTDPGGKIWVTAERDGDTAVLRVRDNGIGIAPEILPRIFDLFVQAERRLNRSQGGVGIGLTLVRRLVELHGGTIGAFSSGLNQGSEFVVRLPARTHAPAVPPPSAQEDDGRPRASRGQRLLVVDDNADAATSLATLLELDGHQVSVAFDGPAALVLARDFHPAVVFLDLGMPGMDGYEVARRLRLDPSLNDTLLVALTGWGQDEERRRSQERGFDYHLVKPVEMSAIRAILEKARSAT